MTGKIKKPIAGDKVPKRETPFLPWLGKLVFAIFGWGFKNDFPNIPKFVAIIGPHASNWDFVFGIGVIFILGAKVSWVGKHLIFRKPFGGVLQWRGGIPIDRSSSHGVVDSMITQYKRSDQFILALAREGTREKVGRWRSDFYHIASGAGVPILMVCFDYNNKGIRFGPLIYPSGDFHADMEVMQLVFKNIRGKRDDLKQVI